MMKSWTERKTALTTAWERFVTVDVSDEEEARVGRLFCVMMVLSFLIALVLTYILASAIARGNGCGPVAPVLLWTIQVAAARRDGDAPPVQCGPAL